MAIFDLGTYTTTGAKTSVAMPAAGLGRTGVIAVTQVDVASSETSLEGSLDGTTWFQIGDTTFTSFGGTEGRAVVLTPFMRLNVIAAGGGNISAKIMD